MAASKYPTTRIVRDDGSALFSVDDVRAVHAYHAGDEATFALRLALSLLMVRHSALVDLVARDDPDAIPTMVVPLQREAQRLRELAQLLELAAVRAAAFAPACH